MLKNLTLKQTSVFMVVLLLSAGGVFFGASTYINSEVHSVKTAWTEFQLVRSEKARLGGQLRAALGYGGMIHSFKNFVLRKDPHLFEIAQERIGGVDAFLDQYSLLPLSGVERAAIDDILVTMVAYHQALTTVKEAVTTGQTSSQIDTVSKVDDSLALRGLETLALEAQHSVSETGVVTKSVLIADLLSVLGYGGMIHNFKNYVLRGDDAYREAAQKNLTKLQNIIKSFRSFDLQRGEVIALTDLETTLGAYSRALNTIQKMVGSGAHIEDIDAEVRVDDVPALRALNLLVLESNLEILSRSRAVDRSLKTIIQTENILTAGTIFLMFFIAALLFWLLRKQVVAPLDVMSRNMRRIAGGDYVVDIPDPSGNNEIADMTRDLKVLLQNSVKRYEAEKGLADANEELNRQLIEVEALRDQSDQQAALAVELAETLAASKEEADAAKAQALSDERRTRSIMNTVTDAIITINAKGIIETFNTGAQTIFGYAPEEVIGRNVSFLMPEPTRSAHDGYLHTFLDGRATRIAGRTIEQVALRKDTTTFPIDLSVNPMYLGDEISFIGIIRDITERKAAEDEIRRLALTDPLTDLANRNAFNTRFADALSQARRRETHVALLMIDLDKFKPVNDQYGHPVGDAVLIEVANCLRTICRETDIVARLGGDEFAAILTDLNDVESAIAPAEKIIAALKKPMTVLGQTVQIGASIGIAYFPGDADSEDTLVTLADNALYAAKAAGRNTFRVHKAD